MFYVELQDLLAVVASSFIAKDLNVAARSSTSGPWKHCLKVGGNL